MDGVFGVETDQNWIFRRAPAISIVQSTPSPEPGAACRNCRFRYKLDEKQAISELLDRVPRARGSAMSRRCRLPMNRT
jgi:hypothetical protein